MTFIKSILFTLSLISGFVLFSSTAISQSTLIHDISITPDNGVNTCIDSFGNPNTLTVPAGTDVLFCFHVTNIGPKTYETHTASTNPFGLVIEDEPLTLLPGITANVGLIRTINNTLDITANWQVPTTAYDRRIPTFDFVDISSTGTALVLDNDGMGGVDGEANVTLDFPFTLYGLTSDEMTIGNNGAIRLGVLDAEIDFDNQSIETDSANNLIAPFWDDLGVESGEIYHQTIGDSPSRVFIVQWHERGHFLGPGEFGEATFQVKLFETTNVIEFHYQDVVFGLSGSVDNGNSATVGIGGNIRSDQFSFNTASLSDNFAISYTPVYAYALNNPTYDFVDISTTGTSIVLFDDGEADVSMDFPFTLYGLTSQDMTIGNNGAIRLGVSGAQVRSENQPMTDDTDNNLIAPFWDDIDNNVGNVFHETIGTTPNRVFIVQWHQRGHFNNIGASTFQVKLYETTNVIEFHYLDVQFENAEFDFGASATVGIGGSVHSDQYSFNTPSIADRTAISYTPIYPYSVEEGLNIYDFEDISTTGAALVLDNDGFGGIEGEADVTLDFPFTLYGLISDQMTVGNNGAIRFGGLDAEISFNNQLIETDIANNLIAPFWDDFSNTSGDIFSQIIGTTPNRVFIVQWNERSHCGTTGICGAPTTGTATFQVKLFETTNVIEFHYQDVDFGDPAFNNGASATVGIGGLVHGDLFSRNTVSLQNQLGIRYTPSTIDSASATGMIVVDDVIFANGFE